MHTVQIAGCYYPKPLPQVFTQSRLILKEAASTIAKRTSTPVVECDEKLLHLENKYLRFVFLYRCSDVLFRRNFRQQNAKCRSAEILRRHASLHQELLATGDAPRRRVRASIMGPLYV